MPNSNLILCPQQIWVSLNTIQLNVNFSLNNTNLQKMHEFKNVYANKFKLKLNVKK